MSGAWRRSLALRWGLHSCYAGYALALVAAILATVAPAAPAAPQTLLMAVLVAFAAVRIPDVRETSLVTVVAVSLTVGLLAHSGTATGWPLIGYEVPVVFAAVLGRSWRSHRPPRP